jgi:hypothetical protein
VLSSGPALLSREYCSSVTTAAAAQSLGYRLGQCTHNWLPDLVTRPKRKTAVANLFSPFGYQFATVAKKNMSALRSPLIGLRWQVQQNMHLRHAEQVNFSSCNSSGTRQSELDVISLLTQHLPVQQRQIFDINMRRLRQHVTAVTTVNWWQCCWAVFNMPKRVVTASSHHSAAPSGVAFVCRHHQHLPGCSEQQPSHSLQLMR